MSYDDVEIEDMEWNDELQAFTYPCPCGDLFQITKEELRIGEEIARCPSCSLYITVSHGLVENISDVLFNRTSAECAVFHEEILPCNRFLDDNNVVELLVVADYLCFIKELNSIRVQCKKVAAYALLLVLCTESRNTNVSQVIHRVITIPLIKSLSSTTWPGGYWPEADAHGGGWRFSACHVGVEVEKIKRILALQPVPLRDLEQIEEMILLPPFGLKYPHKINLNDEFLNASSLARNIFFPKFDAIDPRQNVENNSYYHYPGRIWLDTDGNPIQAHGGGILYDEKLKTYYWYGEYKNGPTYPAHETGTARVDVIGVGCYSSKNLWAWKYEGIVLAAEENNKSHDLHKLKVLERPKVIHNDRTGKYVMWMHIDDATYQKASVGIAISDFPTGPFEYLYSRRPNGFDSRDMTVFKDDNGIAYLIYSSVRNKGIHITPLNQDYIDVTDKMARALIGQHREAPAVFKHEGVYYMVTSGCSGWSPNEALVHEAESVLGPWESIGNPCVGANKDFRVATFFAQSTFVLPMPDGAPGSFIFMADRWNPADLRDSRYVWLPLTVRVARKDRYVGVPLWSRVSIFWHEKWRIPVGENELKRKLEN
ncbi:hypothetical protein BUALT_Bualt15G0031100 [Buddleja alternifolia]|uniref:DPH-type MB domain-containing protein n=1 Tax=Buddleja alternifolia TaxID=168488 RepID=A0AAV6WKB4_9LAMI|nr:hypothetical protein BUALT_Bualt15G0031100 [Buddleja alternifolia]